MNERGSKPQVWSEADGFAHDRGLGKGRKEISDLLSQDGSCTVCSWTVGFKRFVQTYIIVSLICFMHCLCNLHIAVRFGMSLPASALDPLHKLLRFS